MRGQFDASFGFSENVFSRNRVKPCCFMTFIGHMLFENFFEIPQVFQKIRRLSPSVLPMFINFSDFIILPYDKETNDTITWQTMSQFFYFQPTLNRFFNNCTLTLFRMGFFGAAHGWEGGLFAPPLPKIRHTYPTMIKLGTVIPYLTKIQKMYKSRDTFLEFCWH